jgi:uncharacterized protein YbaP (TraB family)
MQSIKSSYLRHLCYTLIILLVSVSLTAFAENDKGLLWKVKTEQNTLYLFGSMHVAKPDLYPLRAEILDAFNSSNNLVVEVNIQNHDMLALQQWMAQHAYYPSDDSIKNHISAETWQRLLAFMQSNNLPPEALIQQRPGLLMVTLGMIELMKLGLDPSLGLDLHFLQQAEGKTIIELETMQSQMELLLNIPDSDLALLQTLDDLEILDEVMSELTQAWKRGDEKALAKMLIEDVLSENPEYQPIYDALFFNRNRTMVNKIEAMLKQQNIYFVVVGAGHLVGEQGIIDILNKKGYAAERL